MPAQNQTLVIEKEAACVLVATIVTRVGGVKTPVNLTGYSVSAQGREFAESPTPFFDASTANGQIVLTTPASGVLTMTIPSSVTKNILETEGVWDLKITPPAGEPIFALRGKVRFIEGVTR